MYSVDHFTLCPATLSLDACKFVSSVSYFGTEMKGWIVELDFPVELSVDLFCFRYFQSEIMILSSNSRKNATVPIGKFWFSSGVSFSNDLFQARVLYQNSLKWRIFCTVKVNQNFFTWW